MTRITGSSPSAAVIAPSCCLTRVRRHVGLAGALAGAQGGRTRPFRCIAEPPVFSLASRPACSSPCALLAGLGASVPSVLGSAASPLPFAVCTLADLSYDIYHATIDSSPQDGTAQQEYYVRQVWAAGVVRGRAIASSSGARLANLPATRCMVVGSATKSCETVWCVACLRSPSLPSWSLVLQATHRRLAL